MSKAKFDASVFGDFDMEAPPRDVELKDRHGKPIGLTVTVVARQSDKYQRAFKAMKNRVYHTQQKGKNLTADERFDNEERIFIARVSGWSISGALKEKVGDLDFNPSNAREIFFNTGPFGVRLREQIESVASELDEGFDEE